MLPMLRIALLATLTIGLRSAFAVFGKVAAAAARALNNGRQHLFPHDMFPLDVSEPLLARAGFLDLREPFPRIDLDKAQRPTHCRDAPRTHTDGDDNGKRKSA